MQRERASEYRKLQVQKNRFDGSRGAVLLRLDARYQRLVEHAPNAPVRLPARGPRWRKAAAPATPPLAEPPEPLAEQRSLGPAAVCLEQPQELLPAPR